MIVLDGISDVPPAARGGGFAIGNFDGVHRGHQALLHAAKQCAAELGAPAGAILFEPHPREFFEPDKPHFRLTPLKRKLELFEEFGVDVAVVLTFDAALARLTAQDFVERVVVEALAARHIVIGYNFRFGKGRAGDAETLRRASRALGFGVTVVPQVGEAG
ncbi:MAG: bifunctional riboflavin kinase/FMN adenylyltransferase, partial [Hyphomicrobiaceae bacterium]|nr:bifunctional riboflavin kinase/FMN adenylyltransferase [Hyphomicrobiaceae bacterium]